MAKAQVHVRFYSRAVEDKKATREKGHPIFKDVPYVCIKFPGDQKRELHAPAHEKAYLATPEDQERGFRMGDRVSYAERYADHWKIFEADQAADQVVGTPLSELTFLTEAQRKTLRAQNIQTAEMLAQLEGPTLKSLGMNGRTLKDQAAAYLKKAEGMADIAKISAENAEMKAHLESLMAQLAEARQEQQKRGPGRPRKEEAAA